MVKIGLGGGCHWCTEAVFQSLTGVTKVDQGWISSININSSFSEGVIVHFNPKEIDLLTLITIHLYTHSCTAAHSMRGKYRSAIYTYSNRQADDALECLGSLKIEFDKPIITQVLPYKAFKINQQAYLNYYEKSPGKPFCQTYITPKLSLLMKKFKKVINQNKLDHLVE